MRTEARDYRYDVFLDLTLSFQDEKRTMYNSIEESPLYPIVNPRSITFFGASNNYTAMGTSILRSILDFSFEGDIYPVHPKEDRVQGLDAYKSVLDIPEPSDLAILVLPTAIVADVLSECG